MLLVITAWLAIGGASLADTPPRVPLPDVDGSEPLRARSVDQLTHEGRRGAVPKRRTRAAVRRASESTSPMSWLARYGRVERRARD